MRTNTIFGVTIAKFANIYVEANSPEEAMKIVGDNLDKIYDELMWEIDEQFDDSSMAVHSCDAEPEGADDYMDHIWADGEILTYDEYMDELDGDEEEEDDMPSLFDSE